VGVEQFLGAPKIITGTGFHQALAVAEHLKKWDLIDNISGMAFDTTASNTGIENGACVILQEILGKELLNFPCRHHIDELILKAVFFKCLGPSKGPENSIFKRFRSEWDNLDHTKYIVYDFQRFSHEEGEDYMDAVEVKSIIRFCEKQLEVILL
jgi:hypothetical protein